MNEIVYSRADSARHSVKHLRLIGARRFGTKVTRIGNCPCCQRRPHYCERYLRFFGAWAVENYKALGASFLLSEEHLPPNAIRWGF